MFNFIAHNFPALSVAHTRSASAITGHNKTSLNLPYVRPYSPAFSLSLFLYLSLSISLALSLVLALSAAPLVSWAGNGR